MLVVVLFIVVGVIQVNFAVLPSAEVHVLVDVGYCRVLMLMLVHQIAVPVRVGVTVSRMGVLVRVNYSLFFFFLLLVTVGHRSSPPPWKWRYRPSVAFPKVILTILSYWRQP
ncbi:hypothetical protein [Ammonifex degensii]|nr:hypothetical protein [Ammonifex degensii]